MVNFFDRPILNSPYAYPTQHWQLTPDGQPTDHRVRTRRKAEFLTPIPKPKKRRKSQADRDEPAEQQELTLFDTAGISGDSQTYDLSLFINSVRKQT